LFEELRDTTLALRQALIDSRWDTVGEILRDAHPQRKRLSPNITTPHMDKLIDIALANGAIAPKVCGAGGGGCIAFFCEPDRKADVVATLRNAPGAEVLDFNVSGRGLHPDVR